MGYIIVKRSFGQEKYPFLELVESPKQALMVRDAIVDALSKSFNKDECTMGKAFREKIQTQHEIRRRTGILCDWYRTMRCECGYSNNRACDTLHIALRTELNGGKFEPPPAEGMYGQKAAQGER